MARKNSPQHSLARLLEATSLPVALFGGNRELLFLNAAGAAWLGIATEEFLGQAAVFSSPPISGSPLAGIAPPPEACAGNFTTGSIFSTTAEPAVRIAHFVPIPHEGEMHVCMVAEALASSPEEGLGPRGQHLWRTALQTFQANHPGAAADVYLIGESSRMQRFREQLFRLVLPTRSHVSIVSSTGCGAEAIVQRLVTGGSTQAGLPITLDCAVHSTESVDDWLRSLARFGRDTPLAEVTIFLRDVHRLAADAQHRIFRWMKSLTGPPRFITTSAVALRRLAREKKFHADLADEFSLLTVCLPRLSRRPADVPLLVQWLVERENAGEGTSVAGFTADALDRLLAYRWPGNVDELAMFVREACSRAKENWVTPAELPDRLKANWQALQHPSTQPQPIALDALLGEMEKEILVRALRSARQNRSKAAELLGISRQRLVRRLLQLGLLAAGEESIDFQPFPGDDTGADS